VIEAGRDTEAKTGSRNLIRVSVSLVSFANERLRILKSGSEPSRWGERQSAFRFSASNYFPATGAAAAAGPGVAGTTGAAELAGAAGLAGSFAAF